jgi:thioredoxin 1
MTVRVEFFATPGCGKCAQAKAALKDVTEGFDPAQVRWLEVDILQEMDYAIDLGIVGASAIAVDGELTFPKLPKPEALRRELERRLATVG